MVKLARRCTGDIRGRTNDDYDACLFAFSGYPGMPKGQDSMRKVSPLHLIAIRCWSGVGFD